MKIGDDDKLSVLPASTTGSLSSITTTSLVSDKEFAAAGGSSDGGASERGDDKSEKQLIGIQHEKWWQTTIQVSIPFFIAGIGTIGAGIILGRVEVRL
jgi:solute carrier family 41